MPLDERRNGQCDATLCRMRRVSSPSLLPTFPLPLWFNTSRAWQPFVPHKYHEFMTFVSSIASLHGTKVVHTGAQFSSKSQLAGIDTSVALTHLGTYMAPTVGTQDHV
jgi:hypothetical protein